MSLRDKISQIYPGIDTKYVPESPSITLRSQIEAELSKGASPEGFKRLKSIIETESNYMESLRTSSFTPKSFNSELSDRYRDFLRSESTRG